MEDFIRDLHVIGRWVVTAATILAFARLLWGMSRQKPYDKQMHMTVAIWSGLVGLQWLLGILLFLVLGDFDIRNRWLHAGVMTLVVVVAHTYVPLKKRDDRVRYQGALGSMVAVLALVFVGVNALTW
jgi:FtsH-binding integral membrane protein